MRDPGYNYNPDHNNVTGLQNKGLKRNIKIKKEEDLYYVSINRFNAVSIYSFNDRFLHYIGIIRLIPIQKKKGAKK